MRLHRIDLYLSYSLEWLSLVVTVMEAIVSDLFGGSAWELGIQTRNSFQWYRFRTKALWRLDRTSSWNPHWRVRGIILNSIFCLSHLGTAVAGLSYVPVALYITRWRWYKEQKIWEEKNSFEWLQIKRGIGLLLKYESLVKCFLRRKISCRKKQQNTQGLPQSPV